MISHELAVSGHVRRRKVVEFECLSLNPTEWLQILQQEIIFWQLQWQLDAVVVASLRSPRNRLDFLDLLVVRR